MTCLIEVATIEAYLDEAEAKRKKVTDELVMTRGQPLGIRQKPGHAQNQHAKLPHPENEQVKPHMIVKGPLALTKKGKLR